MATSGTFTYTTTRQTIIENALALLEVYGVGLPIQTEDYSLAGSVLNNMVKAWQMQGLHLWKRQEAYVFLDQYVSQYNLAHTTPAKAADVDDSVVTYTTAASSAGATTITVASVTGMTTTKTIGVVNSSNAIEWFTVSNVNTGTKVITLSGALVTDVTATSNVYYINAFINKPLAITSARRVSGVDQTSSSTLTTIEMEIAAYEDFQNLPTKTQVGANPIMVCYTPYNTFGRLEVWPRPNDSRVYLNLTYEQMVEDWTNAAETPDFPVEWSEALTYGLAVRMAPMYGKEAKLQFLLPMQQQMLKDVMDADAENTSVFFEPER